MNTADFRAKCKRLLGETQWKRELARILGVHYSTAKRWGNGTKPVPSTVAAFLLVLERLPKINWPPGFSPPVVQRQARSTKTIFERVAIANKARQTRIRKRRRNA